MKNIEDNVIVTIMRVDGEWFIDYDTGPRELLDTC